MALDLERTAHQLDTMMSGLKDFSSVQTDRLGESLNLLEGFVQEVFLGKLDTSSGLFQWTPDIPRKSGEINKGAIHSCRLLGCWS